MTADRPLWLRVAHLAVAVVLLSAIGVSSGHTHAQGSINSARTCAVCHGGNQPAGLAPSLIAVDAPGVVHASTISVLESAPVLHRRTVLGSRAPPIA